MHVNQYYRHSSACPLIMNIITWMLVCTVMQRCQTDWNLLSNCCQINNNPCWHFLIHWTFFIPLHEKEIIDYVKHHHKNQNTSPVPFPLQLAERAKEAARVKVVVPLTATVPRESPKLSSRSKTARVPPVGCGEPNVPSKRATSVLLLSLFRAKNRKRQNRLWIERVQGVGH